MQLGDTGSKDSGTPAQSHGADTQLVGLTRDAFFQCGDFRVDMVLADLGQKDLFRRQERGGAVTADSDTQKSGGAAASLGLEDRVQRGFPYAFEVAVGFKARVGQAVLAADVLAAAAFEQQIDAQVMALVFLKINFRKMIIAQVIAAVAAGQAVHSVRPQIVHLGSLRHGSADGKIGRAHV